MSVVGVVERLLVDRGWRVGVPLDLRAVRPVRCWIDPCNPMGELVGLEAAISREMRRERADGPMPKVTA